MTEKVTESPKKVTEEQSSTSPPCSEGTEEHESARERVLKLIVDERVDDVVD